MEPTILYEDKNVLVLNKPAGLVVHGDGRTKENTLADWVLKNYPETENVGEPIVKSSGEIIKRPGIVHRLDRDTSGVMLVARNQESFESLKNQFKNHEIEKEYNAFVVGLFKDKIGVIDRPIARSKKDFRMWSAQRGSRGELREAVTNYSVMKENSEYSFLEVFPKTGRTHQIRVHMKAINHPLVGDSLYGGNKKNNLGFNRTALHSKKVTFHDLEGKIHSIEAPYPEDFNKALALLQN